MNSDKPVITPEIVQEFFQTHFQYNVGVLWDKFLASKQPIREPIFKTLDGKEIFEGDDFFFVCGEWKTRSTAQGYCWVSDGIRAFSTKEAAEIYIANNKPLYSKEDMRKCFEESRRIKYHKNGDASQSFADFDHYVDYLKSIQTP